MSQVIIRYSRPSRIDIDSAYSYIAKHNQTAAIAWLDSFEKRITQLKAFPLMGQLVDPSLLRSSQEGLRLFSLDGYIVFYYAQKGDVYVNRVLHKKRDLAGILMTYEVLPYEEP
jgi:plasmid stabilization system protein ParE